MSIDRLSTYSDKRAGVNSIKRPYALLCIIATLDIASHIVVRKKKGSKDFAKKQIAHAHRITESSMLKDIVTYLAR